MQGAGLVRVEDLVAKVEQAATSGYPDLDDPHARASFEGARGQRDGPNQLDTRR